MIEVSEIIQAHDQWRSKCINLIPSENILSQNVRKALSTDMASRYTLPINQEIHGSFVENAYRGTRGLDEVERYANELASDIFSAKHVTFAPLSGHIAAMGALLSLCEKGDTVMAISSDNGGYDGYGADYLPDMLDMKAETLPFDSGQWNVDIERAIEKIHDTKPKLVMLGASFFPFPHPTRELSKACKEVHAYLAYDGCHVFGLIAGKEFQDPLAEGVDLMIGNTHKSFFGPQGGALLTNDDEIFTKVKKNMTWRTVDNIHWNRIAATAQSLVEMKEYGVRYATQVVKNSKALAKALDDLGLQPLLRDRGYTASHQVLLDSAIIKEKWGMDLNSMAVALEQNNIITDAVGRLGTNEITRLGMKEDDMHIVAKMIIKVLDGENIAKNVKNLRKSFEISFF